MPKEEVNPKAGEHRVKVSPHSPTSTLMQKRPPHESLSHPTHLLLLPTDGDTTTKEDPPAPSLGNSLAVSKPEWPMLFNTS